MIRPFKKPKNGNLVISKSQVNEYNRKLKDAVEDLKIEMIEKCSLMFTAYAMDEEIINRDPEKIVEMYTKLVEWAEHVEDHTISINTVIDIINEATGEELVRWEKNIPLQ